MPDAVFPFPGGKSRLSSWIREYLPAHTCYVEVFGGAAGVLVNKPPSKVEVYNDRDGDLVHFFEVLRERQDELVAWLDRVPYSRAVHSQWADAYYQGYRPNDPIERAGQFFYLRYTQWGGLYAKPAGFATAKTGSRAKSYANKRERLDEFAARFDDVVLENLDWADVLEKYDGPDTVFYCDPPYVGQEDYYRVPGLDHEAFVDTLDTLEGKWLVSYTELPAGLDEYHVVGKDENHYIGSGKQGRANRCRERLVMNFEPEQIESFGAE